MVLLSLRKCKYMGHVKRESVFEHAQNTQIQIHPAHVQSLIWAFALLVTAKALIRLCGSAV